MLLSHPFVDIVLSRSKFIPQPDLGGSAFSLVRFSHLFISTVFFPPNCRSIRNSLGGSLLSDSGEYCSQRISFRRPFRSVMMSIEPQSRDVSAFSSAMMSTARKMGRRHEASPMR